MLRILALSLFSFFIILIDVEAQGATDTLHYSGLRDQYTLNGREIKGKEVFSLLKSNKEALDLFQAGRHTWAAGRVMQGVGGAFIIYWFGRRIGTRGEIKSTPMLTGIGIAGLGLVVSSLGTPKVKRAFRIYNASLPQEDVGQLKIQAGLVPNGLALQLSF